VLGTGMVTAITTLEARMMVFNLARIQSDDANDDGDGEPLRKMHNGVEVGQSFYDTRQMKRPNMG